MTLTPYGSVLTHLSREDPDRIALTCGDTSRTRSELEARANRLARSYAAKGVDSGSTVSLLLPNGVELVEAMLAVWKLGAIPNPLSHRLPAAERAAILERAEPSLVIGVDDAAPWSALPAGFEPPADTEDGPLEEPPPHNERALASGGSTGQPKLIVARADALYDLDVPSPIFGAKRAALVPGPIHHAAPFSACFQALFAGAHVVLMPRFDASGFLALVERHRVDRVIVVPTMMLRIMKLPEAERLARDVSSLEFVMSGGAPLPAWLMRAWIEWLGPEVMHEAFGPSERIGGTFITGTEWLEHPGSVGKPIGGGRIRIQDESGQVLPAGEMGEIFMMPEGGPGSTYAYVGARAHATEDGWESVGDMGYLDADGYLYLGDRKTDMILCGGHNVYPAEVEAALEAHPAVRSSAVIGLPDDDLGQRVHAIVEADAALTLEDVRAHLEERLVDYKRPRSLEAVDTPLRDDAGKVRRSRLRDERIR